MSDTDRGNIKKESSFERRVREANEDRDLILKAIEYAQYFKIAAYLGAEFKQPRPGGNGWSNILISFGCLVFAPSGWHKSSSMRMIEGKWIGSWAQEVRERHKGRFKRILEEEFESQNDILELSGKKAHDVSVLHDKINKIVMYPLNGQGATEAAVLKYAKIIKDLQAGCLYNYYDEFSDLIEGSLYKNQSIHGGFFSKLTSYLSGSIQATGILDDVRDTITNVPFVFFGFSTMFEEPKAIQEFNMRLRKGNMRRFTILYTEKTPLRTIEDTKRDFNDDNTQSIASILEPKINSIGATYYWQEEQYKHISELELEQNRLAFEGEYDKANRMSDRYFKVLKLASVIHMIKYSKEPNINDKAIDEAIAFYLKVEDMTEKALKTMRLEALKIGGKNDNLLEYIKTSDFGRLSLEELKRYAHWCKNDFAPKFTEYLDQLYISQDRAENEYDFYIVYTRTRCYKYRREQREHGK